MRIVWDEHKRVWNIEKHGFDFDDLDEDFFVEAMFVETRARRLKAVGFFGSGVLAVILALLGREGISIISMRPASRRERRLYAEFRSQGSRAH